MLANDMLKRIRFADLLDGFNRQPSLWRLKVSSSDALRYTHRCDVHDASSRAYATTVRQDAHRLFYLFLVSFLLGHRFENCAADVRRQRHAEHCSRGHEIGVPVARKPNLRQDARGDCLIWIF